MLPEILYFTKHRAVGAPYHRQYQGIISSYEVMEADYNRDTVKRNLLNTDAAYILIKKPKPDKNRHDLPHMIASNIIPAGMNVVKFPPKFKDIVILKTDKSRL